MTPEDMQERDIVEFTDDNGNTLMLEVMDYFYYNGQEFAALCTVVLLFYHRPKRKSMGNEREKEKTERSDASPRA